MRCRNLLIGSLTTILLVTGTSSTFAADKPLIGGSQTNPSTENLVYKQSTPTEIRSAEAAEFMRIDPSLKTVKSAEQWMDKNEKFVRTLAVIQDKYPDTYSRSKFNVDNNFDATLWFTQAPKPELQKLVSSLPMKVDLRSDGKFTEKAAAKATEAASKEFFEKPGVGEGTADFDHETGTVKVRFNVEPGQSPENLVAKNATDTAEAATVAANTPGRKVEVKFAFDSDLNNRTALISGGTALNEQSNTRDAVCTAGFTASNGQYRGLITAAHCGTSLGYEGNNPRLTFTYGSGAYDVAFHRSSDSISPNFVWDRYGATLYTKPVLATGTAGIGNGLCTYGSTTARLVCTKVEAVGQARYIKTPNGTILFRDQTTTVDKIVDPGDSGGPWHVGSGTALGITSGYSIERWESSFTPIRRAEAVMGVTVRKG